MRPTRSFIRTVEPERQTMRSSTESATNSSSSTSKGLFYGAGISASRSSNGAPTRTPRMIGSLGLKIAERQYADAYRQLAILIREQYMGLISKKITLRNENFKPEDRRGGAGGAAGEVRVGRVLAGRAAELPDGPGAGTSSAVTGPGRTSPTPSAQFTRLVGIDDPADDAAIPLMVPHPDYSAALADAVLAGFVGKGIESTFQNQVYQMTSSSRTCTYSIAKVRLLPKAERLAELQLRQLHGGRRRQRQPVRPPVRELRPGRRLDHLRRVRDPRRQALGPGVASAQYERQEELRRHDRGHGHRHAPPARLLAARACRSPRPTTPSSTPR